MSHEEGQGADPSRPASRDDAGKLEDELAGRSDRDGALAPAVHHAREERVPRGHHQGAQGAHGDPVGEQRWIAERVDAHYGRQRQRWERGQEMITKQKAATIPAIRDGAAQQHEGDGGRHDGHLG